jgi:hypothetical protein
MDEKLKSQYRPIEISGTFKYVPHAFREFPIEDRPVFELRRLDGLTILRLEDKLYGRVYEVADDKQTGGTRTHVEVNRGAFMAHVAIIGIAGWRNYFDLKHDTEKHEELCKRLPADLLRELANAITERQEMTREELQGLE